LIGAIGRSVNLHACSDANKKAGGKVPKDDSGWQGDSVSDALGEVEEKEDVAKEAADKGGYIDVVAPRSMLISHSPSSIASSCQMSERASHSEDRHGNDRERLNLGSVVILDLPSRVCERFSVKLLYKLTVNIDVHSPRGNECDKGRDVG